MLPTLLHGLVHVEQAAMGKGIGDFLFWLVCITKYKIALWAQWKNNNACIVEQYVCLVGVITHASLTIGIMINQTIIG